MSESPKEKITEETTKNKRLDKIFWFKVCISLIFGILFGVLKFRGFIAFLGFVIGSTILTSLYFSKYVSPDEDVDYQGEIFTEGMNVSIPLFLACWILSYTLTKYYNNTLNVVSTEL